MSDTKGIPEVRVESWAQLQDLLYEGSYDERLARFRSPFVYRGLALFSRELQTSLQRLSGESADLERHLLRNFRKYAPRGTVPPGEDQVWNWLALAQHYGLPTRLLDWTFSPYIALHFATTQAAAYEEDAVVWCVNYVAAKDDVPEPLRQGLDEESVSIFTTDRLVALAPTLNDLERYASDEPFPIFWEPPSIDERIVNQNALFSFMSTAEATLDQWLASRPYLARRLIIPSAMKWEIRDKLDQAGITERLLFPGLDGLAKWLKRYYSPRRPAEERVEGERDEGRL